LSISPDHKAAAGLLHESKGEIWKLKSMTSTDYRSTITLGIVLRFLRVCDDKKPQDAITSQEIVELYERQVNKQETIADRDQRAVRSIMT
jgi:hypothetical protein